VLVVRVVRVVRVVAATVVGNHHPRLTQCPRAEQ
jgi:hypothetical protein